MKVLLISPGIDGDSNRTLAEANSSRTLTPMLSLPYLAALTPPEIQIKVIDEIHGISNNYEEADLVGITGMTMQANRMYTIADMYRSMNIPVVLGGVHVTFMYEEAARHGNSVVIGEAEDLWLKIINDFYNNKLKRYYHCKQYPSLSKLPTPRLDLMKGPMYSGDKGSLNVVMATRGCPYQCSYCSVSKMCGRKYRRRPVDHVVNEIERISDNNFFFSDDNLIANKKYSKELFRKLKKLQKKWGAQVSINIAEDEEMLDLAHDCGCISLFIGIESTNPNNLAEIKKSINKVEKYSDSIKKIHDRGIHIHASFMVGFDDDQENVFDDIYNFSVTNKIENPVVNIVTPLPGTDLYKKLLGEGRIINNNWEKYNFLNVVFQPNNLSVDALQNKFEELNKGIRRYKTGLSLVKYRTESGLNNNE